MFFSAHFFLSFSHCLFIWHANKALRFIEWPFWPSFIYNVAKIVWSMAKTLNYLMMFCQQTRKSAAFHCAHTQLESFQANTIKSTMEPKKYWIGWLNSIKEFDTPRTVNQMIVGSFSTDFLLFHEKRAVNQSDRNSMHKSLIFIAFYWHNGTFIFALDYDDRPRFYANICTIQLFIML